ETSSRREAIRVDVLEALLRALNDRLVAHGGGAANRAEVHPRGRLPTRGRRVADVARRPAGAGAAAELRVRERLDAVAVKVSAADALPLPLLRLGLAGVGALVLVIAVAGERDVARWGRARLDGRPGAVAIAVGVAVPQTKLA